MKALKICVAVLLLLIAVGVFATHNGCALGPIGWSCPAHDLARSGNVAELNDYLQKYPHSIEARDKWGCTPLMHAASAAQVETADLLLMKGARVQVRSNKGGFIIEGVQGRIANCTPEYLKEQEHFMRMQKPPLSEDAIQRQLQQIKDAHSPQRKQRWETILAMLEQAEKSQKPSADK